MNRLHIDDTNDFNIMLARTRASGRGATPMEIQDNVLLVELGLVIPEVETNDPRFAGQLASRKQLFGEHSRYAVFAVHTRFLQVEWFITDAMILDDSGLPTIIRQAPSLYRAICDLN